MLIILKGLNVKIWYSSTKIWPYKIAYVLFLPGLFLIPKTLISFYYLIIIYDEIGILYFSSVCLHTLFKSGFCWFEVCILDQVESFHIFLKCILNTNISISDFTVHMAVVMKSGSKSQFSKCVLGIFCVHGAARCWKEDKIK